LYEKLLATRHLLCDNHFALPPGALPPTLPSVPPDTDSSPADRNPFDWARDTVTLTNAPPPTVPIPRGVADDRGSTPGPCRYWRGDPWRPRPPRRPAAAPPGPRRQRLPRPPPPPPPAPPRGSPARPRPGPLRHGPAQRNTPRR